jgi:hypothetical protein
MYYISSFYCITRLTLLPPPSPAAAVTPAADGDEGGRHQLIAATVSGGKLWICKIQVGDKRWFKGAKNEALGTFNSFTVA